MSSGGTYVLADFFVSASSHPCNTAAYPPDANPLRIAAEISGSPLNSTTLAHASIDAASCFFCYTQLQFDENQNQIGTFRAKILATFDEPKNTANRPVTRPLLRPERCDPARRGGGRAGFSAAGGVSQATK
jgi:hypothetical protein